MLPPSESLLVSPGHVLSQYVPEPSVLNSNTVLITLYYNHFFSFSAAPS